MVLKLAGVIREASEKEKMKTENPYQQFGKVILFKDKIDSSYIRNINAIFIRISKNSTI